MQLIPYTGQPPRQVRKLVRVAQGRIERFQKDWHVDGFVPSDFLRVWSVLAALAEQDPARGNLFCEWGSGFGVVACLAAMLDFDACGIEIDADLVDHARRLADDFDLPVEFLCGSFIPRGSKVEVEIGSGYSWLTTDERSESDELELGPDDFDVIFAYPWPDEEHVIADLFKEHAHIGAILVTYHGGDEVRLRRLVP